eukprot:scaffold2782_cov46-Attheya_sp.AAC.1
MEPNDGERSIRLLRNKKETFVTANRIRNEQGGTRASASLLTGVIGTALPLGGAIKVQSSKAKRSKQPLDVSEEIMMWKLCLLSGSGFLEVLGRPGEIRCLPTQRSARKDPEPDSMRRRSSQVAISFTRSSISTIRLKINLFSLIPSNDSPGYTASSESLSSSSVQQVLEEHPTG